MAKTTRRPAKGSARGSPKAKAAKAGPGRGARPSGARGGGRPARGAAPRRAPPKAQRATARKGAARPAVRAEAVAPPAPPRPGLDEARERAAAAVQGGLDKKAEHAVVLDVRTLSGVADYFVLMSADSERQAGAVADAVDEKVTALGAIRLGVEGRGGGGWVLLDFGDVVVHVMDPETRKFYDLEGLWADAPRVKLD
jgi:ribosome-associated protein